MVWCSSNSRVILDSWLKNESRQIIQHGKDNARGKIPDEGQNQEKVQKCKICNSDRRKLQSYMK